MSSLFTRKNLASAFWSGAMVAIIVTILGVPLCLATPLLEGFVEQVGLNTREYPVESIILMVLSLGILGFLGGGIHRLWKLNSVASKRSVNTSDDI